MTVRCILHSLRGLLAASVLVAATSSDQQPSLVPLYPDVVGEYLQIAGATAPGTPAGLNTSAFLRLRIASDGDQPKPANAVIVAMPGFSSVPSHWLYLGTQLVHKAGQRSCDGVPCRVEVWIVFRRGGNLEDTAGLKQARTKRTPNLALDYYFGQSVLSADPNRPGKFPLTAPDKLTGRSDTNWKPLEQADVRFMADWSFEVQAGDVDRMIALVKQQSGSRNVFLAGHSQGGGFVSNYAGRKLAAGRRGYETLAGLIFLDGGPSAGNPGSPSADQISTYSSNVSKMRSGDAPVYTGSGGLLGGLGGPASSALNSVLGVYYAFSEPDSEAKIFPPRAYGALPTSPVGDDFLAAIRLTYRARAGMSFDVDPVPGFTGVQAAVITQLGEGLGQLDFKPKAGTEDKCQTAQPAPGRGNTPQPPRCMPTPEQLDPNKVYGWLEGGGGGQVPSRVNKAQLWFNSLAYSPSRSNIKPVAMTLAAGGTRTIDASQMAPYNWYQSSRYDSDMQWLGQFRAINVDGNGVHVDIDKAAIAAVPVYVAHRTTNDALQNPFPLVKDFTEINRNGVFQTDEAKAITPFDPKINVGLYFHTDFVSADDSLAGQVTPGQPGASAVANTLLDWLLARSKGRASVPTPRDLGVVTMY